MHTTSLTRPQTLVATALAIGSALVISLLLAAPASAAVSCTSFVNGNLSLGLNGFGQLGVDPATGQIQDQFAVLPGACATATTTNTDTITVSGSGASDALEIDTFAAPFAPGATDEGDGSSEIEFSVDLGIDSDQLFIEGTGTANRIGFGTLGINLNGAEAVRDPDVTVNEVEAVQFDGGAAKDVLDASGGFGTGGDFEIFTELFGFQGNDKLRAGTGGMTLNAGEDNDRLFGSVSNNVFFGGSGEDTAYFKRTFGSVTASLRDGTATGAGSDTLTGIENLVGSRFNDSLIGDDLPNRLRGRRGNDDLLGRAGNDFLDGGKDFDSLFGGSGMDTCVNGEALDSC
jgi:large repetitive protein